MPFTNGVFANVAGASSAAAGQIVQSATWNAIHEDYSDALNELRLIYALVSTTGSIKASRGIAAVSATATGIYVVTLSASMSNTNYPILAVIYGSSINVTITVENISENQFAVRTGVATTGSAANTAFNIGTTTLL